MTGRSAGKLAEVVDSVDLAENLRIAAPIAAIAGPSAGRSAGPAENCSESCCSDRSAADLGAGTAVAVASASGPVAPASHGKVSFV